MPKIYMERYRRAMEQRQEAAVADMDATGGIVHHGLPRLQRRPSPSPSPARPSFNRSPVQISGAINHHDSSNPLTQLADISLMAAATRAQQQQQQQQPMELEVLAHFFYLKRLLHLEQQQRQQQQQQQQQLTPSASPSPPPAHNAAPSPPPEKCPPCPPPAHSSPESSTSRPHFGTTTPLLTTHQLQPEQSVPEDLRIVTKKLEFGCTGHRTSSSEDDESGGYADSVASTDCFSSRTAIMPHHRQSGRQPAGGDREGYFACDVCGRAYSTSSNLARHKQTHRSPEDKQARQCPHCDKTYVSMPAYSMHLRTHSQGCKCPFCGKSFSRPWLLQGHIRTHTGEKPFTCNVCEKAFADKSNLRAHVQTHSNAKPYICRRCNKAFALKSYLYKHEESSCMRAFRLGLKEERKKARLSGGGGRSSIEEEHNMC